MQKIINTFLDLLSERSSEGKSRFDSKVLEDIDKARRKLAEGGLKYDFDVEDVAYSKKVQEENILHRFTGSFVYDFVKDGDLQSKRKTGKGYVEFVENKKTNIITGVFESLAENTYGEYKREPVNMKRKLFMIFILIFAIALPYIIIVVINALKAKFLF